jgi:hypothetical protein
MRRRLGFAAALVPALLAAGCGSATTTTTSSTHPPASNSTATPTATPTPAAEESAKTGQQILEDSSVAYIRAHTVRIHGTFAAGGLTGTFEDALVLGDNRSEHYRVTIRGLSVEMIDTGQARYVKAWSAFLHGEGLSSAAAVRYDGRWLRIDHVPSQFDGELDSDGGNRSIVDCLEEAFGGTLDAAGTRTVNGVAVIEVDSRGDEPGKAKSREYFAAQGPLLPVHFQLLGPVDKSSPTCAGSLAPEVHTLSAATLDYTQYNAPLTITAPADATDIRGTTP